MSKKIENSRKRSNSKSKEIVEISWNVYLMYIDMLIEKIKKSKIKFDYVYGIPRGGLIPATIISHQLGIKMINGESEFDIYYCGNNKILVIDDIVDTSKTIKKFKEKYNEIELTFATIFKHKESPITPEFYVSENSTWIKFPYEK